MIDRTTPGILAAAVLLTAAGAFAVTRLPGHEAAGDAPVTAAAPGLAVPYGPVEHLADPVSEPIALLRAGTGGAAIYAAGSEPTADAAHLLTGAGIPAAVASTPAEAFARPMTVWLGPLAAGEQQPAADYVAHGGILVVFGASTAAERLVVASGRANGQRSIVRVLPGGGIAAAELHLAPFTGAGWRVAGGALARYDDGSAAWVLRRVGVGAIALAGLPVHALVATATAPGDAGTRDVAAEITRALYQLSPLGVSLGGAPGGNAQALVLTHDLDSPSAYQHAPAIAAIEADRGVASTFYAVTRTAASGSAVLTADTAAMLRSLARRGFDISAGGVVPDHFGSLAAGSGSEAYPGYAPSPATGGATRSGEVRVSSHVVRALTRVPPGGFRPPELITAATADALDPILAASGIGVDAAVPAAASGGGMPFRAPAADGREYPVLRLPIAFDDRKGLRVDSRQSELEAILTHAGETGSPAVVRISPAAGSAATFAEQQLLANMPASTWVGPAGAFAAFWSARYALTIDVEPSADALHVRLTATTKAPSQTLVVPYPVSAAVLRSTGQRLPISADGRRVTVPGFTGTTDVELTASGAGA